MISSQMRAAAAMFATWSDFVAERLYNRGVVNRVLLRLQKGVIASGFHGWRVAL